MEARPPGRRERTKAQNRQMILDAARRVFAEMGYAAATVRDIIKATPLASGTFYNYFKSKEDVYQAIRDEVALAIRPRLRAARAEAASLEAFLCEGFRIFFAFVADNQGDFRHLKPDTTRLRIDTPEVIAGFEELRADVEDAIARGLLPAVDADYLMAALVGVGLEMSERMLLRAPSDPDAAARFATALFLGGIKALPVAG